ncbi:hypothetical protein [Thalassospira australica]|uniref:hypothetical protein n=1 Tax=Thalassospira australica TaxID=1528106 RepID=UPI00384D3F97
MKIIRILGGMGVLLLGACSSSGSADYKALLDNPPKTYQSLSEAVKNEETFFVEVDDWETFGVRITDPAIQQGNSLNNFKIGRATLDADHRYWIHVSTLCYECLGFRKKVMPFNAYLFDPDYQQIDTFEGDVQGMGGGGGTFIVAAKSGDYYVLVAADNSRIAETFEGQVDLSTSGVPSVEAMDGGGSILYPVYPSPEGSLMLHVMTAEEE